MKRRKKVPTPDVDCDTRTPETRKYEELVERLRNMRRAAQQFYNDVSCAGLSASQIEAEGYLRCAINTCELIDFIEEMENPL